MATTYLKYNDPIQIIWRQGDINDPYIDVFQTLKVISGRFPLVEVPDEFNRVIVGGFTEIQKDPLGEPKYPAPGQYLVDYTFGVIYFNKADEGKSLTASYKGKGQMLYPAERIYVHSPNPYAVENLQQFIDLSILKLQKIDQAITDAVDATDAAQQATSAAQTATANADLAASDARLAERNANDAAASTLQVYKDPVQFEADVTTTYPNPQNGWRVMVKQTGNIYRFDGVTVPTQWKLIDNWTGGAIPNATDAQTGLFTSDEHKSFTKVRVKSIIFVIPKILNVGVQPPVVKFPELGTIKKVFAYCSRSGVVSQTQLRVQRSTKSNFESGADTWNDVLTVPLTLDASITISPDGVSVTTVVSQDDYFRISVDQYDSQIEGVTIQIDITI